jgi:hypothetical protein
LNIFTDNPETKKNQVRTANEIKAVPHQGGNQPMPLNNA